MEAYRRFYSLKKKDITRIGGVLYHELTHAYQFK
jgi:hypothetical protein